MEHDTADKLYAIVNHVPFNLVASGKPMVFPDGIVTVDADEVPALSSKLAVEFSSLYHDGFVGCEAGGSLAHYGKHFGKMLVELILDGIEDLLLVFVDLIPYGLTLIKGEFLHLGTQTGVFLLLGRNSLIDVSTDVGYTFAELIDGELLDFRLESLDFLHDRFDFLQVAG